MRCRREVTVQKRSATQQRARWLTDGSGIWEKHDTTASRGQISTFQRPLSFASQIVVVVCRVGKLENSSDLVWRVRVCGDG